MTKPDDMRPIGAFSFDPAREELRDPDGGVVALRPQTARVLAALVARAGEVARKDALMDEVWADTHVTDDSLVQCISEIRKALGPREGARLKTVPRQGYRLDIGPAAGGAPPRAPGRGSILVPLAGLVAIAVAAAAVWFTRPDPPPPAPRIVAVLPFDNLSGDDGYDYFAAGLTEDLTVRLSRISDLRVISRAAAASIAERVDDPRQIARELGAAWLIDGSVRRVGPDLRMTTSLVDAGTGENAWADSYEGDFGDIFAFQDAVLAELVRVLAVRLSPSERERLGVRGTTDVAAFDQYLRGLELENFLTPTANRDAEAAFAEALRRDPGYAAAHAHQSLTLSMRAEYNWASDRAATIAAAREHAERAVALDPDLPFAHFARGRLLSRRFIGDIEGALDAFRTAIALDPNYVDAYAFMATVLVFDGRADEARATIEDAFARNPAPPYWYLVPRALSNYFLGDYDTAAAALTELLDRNPNSPHALRILIATEGRRGDADEAQWRAAEYEALGLEATVSAMMASSGIDHPAYRDAYREGLVMAGIPD